MKFSTHDIVKATGGFLVREAAPGRISTDTRSIRPGDWFLALVGERFDGHRFLSRAAAAGAAGFIVSEEPSADWKGGVVRVSDTTKALQNLGRLARTCVPGPTIGITGTTGKTTTRAMISCALAAERTVHQTAGNLNNHLGVPMTLAAIPVDATAVVLEMGTSSPGEIAFLSALANPDIRVVLNVGEGHLEELGGLEGVAYEKGALIRDAQPGQWVCVNLDDPFVRAMPIPAGVRTVTYGRSGDADIQLVEATVDGDAMTTFARYQTPVGNLEICFSSPGVHLAHNGGCALAVAHAAGIPLAGAAKGLSNYEPVGMRQRLEMIGTDIRVLNDAYNANPVSMGAALTTLSGLNGRRIAVLGDMLELGTDEERLHLSIVERAKQLSLDVVLFVGPRFAAVAQPFLNDHFQVVLDEEKAVECLSLWLRAGDTVLFKGSRGSRVERILHTLQVNADNSSQVK